MKILDASPNLEFINKELFDSYDEILRISPFGGIKCEIGAIVYILAIIAKNLGIKEFCNLDEGELIAESNLNDDEVDEIMEFIKRADGIVIDENSLKFHYDADNLKILLNKIAKFLNIKIFDESGAQIEFDEKEFSSLKPLINYDGFVIFKHSKNLDFIGSDYFSKITKLSNNENIKIITKSGVIKRNFKIDDKISGIIGICGVDKVQDYAFEVIKFDR